MLNQLLNSPLIRKTYQISQKHHQDIFLVGGTLRDLYLNASMNNDFDFLVKSNVKSIASDFSKLCKGSFFCLDKKREYYRVVIKDRDENHSIDFSPILNGNIHIDLTSRDFSINSIALRLTDIFEKGSLNPIDPTGGLKDFGERVIRLSSPTAFSHDPVRILRAVRFARKFNFSIESHTLNLIKENIRNLLKCPWERIRSEFFKILSLPHASKSLRELDQLGVLSLMIPEIENMKGVNQGAKHDYELWEHSLKTVHFADTVLLTLKDYFPKHGEFLENYFRQELESDIKRNNLLTFIALLHDIGKPSTRSMQNKQVHFYQHDRIGAKINQGIAHRFKMGKKTTHIITTATHYHLRLLSHHHSDSLTQRAKYRFFRDLDDSSFDTLILSCADKMATRKHSTENRNHLPILYLVNELIDYYFQEYSKSTPKPLLNGNEIMEILTLKPGEKIGELIALIEEAERDGRITTREEAVKIISSETKKHN